MGFKKNVQYTYDDLDHLTSVTYENGQKMVYTYDAAGNPTSVKVTTDTLEMPVAEQAQAMVPPDQVSTPPSPVSPPGRVPAYMPPLPPIQQARPQSQIGRFPAPQSPGPVAHPQRRKIRWKTYLILSLVAFAVVVVLAIMLAVIGASVLYFFS